MTGLIRWIPSKCNVDKFYRFNNRFKAVVGAEYFVNGEVQFPSAPPHYGMPTSIRYRTCYGWNFAHNGVILDDTNDNLRLALRRHLCCREPEVEGNDALLRESLRLRVVQYTETIRRISNAGVDFHWPTTMREDAARLAVTPHPKRKLRSDAWDDLNLTGDVGGEVWLRSCWWKFKQDEIAKPGKYGHIS